MSSKTILLVEDNEFHRMGTTFFLNSVGRTVLETADVESGWKTAVSHHPQTAIIDAVLPARPGELEDESKSLGLQLIRRLKTRFPAMGIVLYSAFHDRGAGLTSLLHDGHMGIAYKIKGAGTTPDSLLRAITAVSQQKIYFDPQIMEMEVGILHAFIAALDPVERTWVLNVGEYYGRLTPTEKRITRLIGSSRSLNGIAQELTITSKTVQNYTNRVYRKLELDNTPASLRKTVILAKGYTLHQMRTAASN